VVKIVGWAKAITVVCCCAALAGCAGADARGPDEAATAFAQAILVSNGDQACALLSPEVSKAVADAEKVPCARAILQEHLPGPSPVRSTQVHGRSAFIVTGTDTLFLSEFKDGWKIIGAGCHDQGARPYDCVVSGG
jgi:hypothetical protein